jgi:acetoacetyl-CoA synthetase
LKFDTELRRVGVRFGTAEIYGIVDKFSQVEDCIAVGQRRDGDIDEQVLLFLKMKSGNLDAQLRNEIASTIRSLLSPRHVPAYILQVKDIPYTMNGKRIENIVRDTVCGRSVKVGGTAINPECLEEYRQFLNLPQISEKSKL